MSLKTIVFHFLFLVLMLNFLSCTKQEKMDEFESNKNKRPVFPELVPSNIQYPKLSESYILSKRNTIEKFCNKYWPNNNNNISFLVAKNGQIIYEKYQGFANKNKNTLITKDTPMHIASVSKVLTATAILILVDYGKIDLDQKLNTILEQFPFPEITIRTLLNHRTGLRNYAYFTEDNGVWDLSKTLRNQDILDLLSEKNIQLESPTDTRFSYCNTNYALLALVIEKITGLSYPEAMKKIIFDPLEMHDTYVFEYDNDRSTATPSYKGNGIELAIDHLDAIYGDKNIYSTPRDLLKFDLARNAPTFLNKKLRAEVYKGYSNERKGTKNYGLGIRMIEWETGQKFYFHNGWWHGNTSSYITLDNENVVIIALSNKFNRNTYAVRKLAPLFGDYPFKFEDAE